MNEELKIVTRQETFNDHAMYELAKTRSACICRLQFKRCTQERCNNCSVHKEYLNCYNAMNDYDKNRLKSYIAEQYNVYSRHPEAWMRHKDYVRYCFKYIFGSLLFIILISLIILSAGIGPFGKPDRPRVEYDTDSKIITTIMQLQLDIRDINYDDKINCIDYTCMFKLIWDQKFPDKAWKCSIVRNKAPGIHHLFICILDKDNNKIFVEPWSNNPYRYLMEENWSTIYDPKNNIFGETDYWMKEVRSD